MLSFAVVATLFDIAKRLASASRSVKVRQVIDAASSLKDDIHAGVELVHDDETGLAMTPAAFAEKFSRWEARQADTSEHAEGRIDQRHAADGTGTP